MHKVESGAKINAIAPWFGGKRNLAPMIVRELGPHKVYWEPFCGSMAVLLAKPKCSMETVNDLHPGLVNLARVIQDGRLGPMLYRRLRRTLMHETLYDDARNEAKEDERRGFVQRILDAGKVADDDSRLLCAYDYFITSWLGRNGCAGQPQCKTGTYCVRFTRNGGHAATRFTSSVASIPAWRNRLRGVTILNRDAFELLERIEDTEGCAIYCDPPYIKKTAPYAHDFDDAAHTRLAAALKRFRVARVVVSYYDHPRLAELYPDWTRICIDVPKAMSHMGKRGPVPTRATEVLLINGPSLTQPSNPLFDGGKPERKLT